MDSAAVPGRATVMRALLAAIGRGQQVPAELRPELPERDNDPPQVAQVTTLLQAVLASYCHERRLTPGLVATSQDVKLLVRSRFAGQPLPAESGLVRGWRAEHVLPLLLSILDGKCAVKVDTLATAAPLRLIDPAPG